MCGFFAGTAAKEMMAGAERRDEASDCAKCIYEAGKCDETVSAGV